METVTAPKNEQPAKVEVTKEEWAGRQLSQYGKMQGIFDIVMVFACLYAIGNLAMVGGVGVPLYAGLIFVLMIIMMKGLLRIMYPRDSYQTVIIREN